MFAPRILSLAIPLLFSASSALADDQNFPFPSGPAKQVTTSGITSLNDNAPMSCDQSTINWMKDWRQRARTGGVNTFIQSNLDQLVHNPPRQANGQLLFKSFPSDTHCIKKPEAFVVKYVSNGDYYTTLCLAQKDGKVISAFEANLNSTAVQCCLGDSLFNQFVNSAHCNISTFNGNGSNFNGNRSTCPKLPSPIGATNNTNDNAAFLALVMKNNSCGIDVVPREFPTFHDVSAADLGAMIKARPELKNIVDPSNMTVFTGKSIPPVKVDPADDSSHDDNTDTKPAPDACSDPGNPFCTETAK